MRKNMLVNFTWIGISIFCASVIQAQVELPGERPLGGSLLTIDSAAEWAVEWSTAAAVTLNARENYAVLDITLGQMPIAYNTYAYQLRYHYGPAAIKALR